MKTKLTQFVMAAAPAAVLLATIAGRGFPEDRRQPSGRTGSADCGPGSPLYAVKGRSRLSAVCQRPAIAASEGYA